MSPSGLTRRRLIIASLVEFKDNALIIRPKVDEKKPEEKPQEPSCPTFTEKKAEAKAQGWFGLLKFTK